jgi:hypothetical protein
VIGFDRGLFFFRGRAGGGVFWAPCPVLPLFSYLIWVCADTSRPL